MSFAAAAGSATVTRRDISLWPEPPVRQKLKRASVFLLFGAFVTMLVCVVLAMTDDLSQSNDVSSAEGWAENMRWTVTRWNSPAGTRVRSSYSSGQNWSPGQALGPPDTPGGGDQVTAWASASSDGAREWLLLDFPNAVVPKSVRVFEMCSTGALDRVEVTRPDGTEVVAWSGVDPVAKGQSMGTSEVPLSAIDFPVGQVRIHFDSPNVAGWNEVDAVALVGVDDGVQWAAGVQASSIYGSGGTAGTPSLAAPMQFAPSWAGIDAPELREIGAPVPQPAGRRPRAFVRRPDVVAEARGWPMLALAGRREVKVPALAPAQSGVVGYVPMSSTNGSMTAMTLTSGTLTLSTPRNPEPPLMLYRPIPLGFAVNTAVAAVVLWLLHWALTVPRRFVRESSRMRRGCCLACGYDLGFDFVPGCPECGWNRGNAEVRFGTRTPQLNRKFNSEHETPETAKSEA